MAFLVGTTSTNPGPAITTTSNITQTPQSNSDGYNVGQSIIDKIAFYGGVPLAQQAATVDLITQLVNLNLIAANTSIQGTGTPINVTAATLTVTPAAHAGRVITLNRAAGVAVTLPAATGTGNRYQFQLGTTVTSNTTTLTTGVTGTGCDSYEGNCLTNDAATVTGYTTAAPGSTTGSDVITLNGTTTGGFIGDYIDLTDIGAGVWMTKMVIKATGTAATPFSHV